jgi:transposase-like protein
MSPKKLTDDDKQEILKLYRQTPETTSTLADRYGVSSSTVSRFLKSYLSESEYEDLIQQKRLARTNKPDFPSLELLLDTPKEEVEETVKPEVPVTPTVMESTIKKVAVVSTPKAETQPTTIPSESPIKKVAVVSTPKAETPSVTTPSELTVKKTAPVLTEVKSSLKLKVAPEEDELEEELEDIDVLALEEMFGEDLLEDEEDDEDEDEDDWDDEELTYEPSFAGGRISVLPLSIAAFPKTCYLVIDRAAELIAIPLKEFGHLGQIPAEEVQQKTLPVFDNHRVARRFSNRSQRVIKIPDGRLLYKTCSYLYAKGITRLLMDGNIYALGMNGDN